MQTVEDAKAANLAVALVATRLDKGPCVRQDAKGASIFRDAFSHLEHASRSIGRQRADLNAIHQEYQLQLETGRMSGGVWSPYRANTCGRS